MKKRFSLLFLCTLLCGSFAYGACVTPGTNFVVNSDFSLGNVGFTSTLGYAQNCLAGYYYVGTSMHSKCSIWPTTFVDHTTGTGNFLICDGNDTYAPQDVWAQTVPVVVNQTYVFSFWAQNLYVQNPFPLGFMINGNQVGVSSNIATGSWNQYSFTWTSNTSGNVVIAIRQITAGLYRDFGVDDVMFGKCDLNDVGIFNLGNATSNPIGIFPNPATSSITLFSNTSTSQPYFIYDIAGKLLQSGMTSGGETIINVAELPEGMYFINVGKNELLQTLKFVKVAP